MNNDNINPKFLWTARRFEGNRVMEEKLFSSKSERDDFVELIPHGKKRGKICAENYSHPLSLKQNKNS